MDYCHQQEVHRQRKDTLLHVVSASSREVEIDIASLTDLEKKEIVLAAEQSVPHVAETQSGQQCLRKYDEAMPNSFKLKQSMKQPMKKQKELWYALQKVKMEGLSMLLRCPKSTRKLLDKP